MIERAASRPAASVQDWICAWARLLCPGRAWVTTVHGEVNRAADFRRQGGLRSAVYAQVLARGFDRVLAVSRDLAWRLVREEGVRSSRLVTLVNGVALIPPSAPTPSLSQRRSPRSPTVRGLSTTSAAVRNSTWTPTRLA